MTRLPDLLLYGGQLTHVTEAVDIMRCSGCSDDYIFRWLGVKLGLVARDGRILTGRAR